MTLPRTPSQTVGPYYAIGLCRGAAERLARPHRTGGRSAHRALLDGRGAPIRDGMIEIWDAAGRRWGAERHRRRRTLLVPGHETGRASRPGAPPRRVRLRARPAPAPADPDLLPGRGGGQRCRSRALRARRGRSRNARRRAGGRCPAVRYPHAGRPRRPSSSSIDDVRVDLRPAAAARCGLRRGVARGDARRRAGPARRRGPGRPRARGGGRGDRRGVPARAVRRRRARRPGPGRREPGRPLVRALREQAGGDARRRRPLRRHEPGHPRHGRDARRAGRPLDHPATSSTGPPPPARRSPRRTARRRWRGARCSSRRFRRPSG